MKKNSLKTVDRQRPIKSMDEVIPRLNDMISDGIGLKTGISGEIITVTFAPNESKVIPHGLRAIPQYRLILRQTGNGVITDVDDDWTDRTIGLLNNSANTLIVTIKLMVE